MNTVEMVFSESKTDPRAKLLIEAKDSGLHMSAESRKKAFVAMSARKRANVIARGGIAAAC
jgi:hypothetical protein